MLHRLGAWCHDQRKLVVISWLALLIVGAALMATAGPAFREEFDLPSAESAVGFQILERDFGGLGTHATGTIVFRAEQGVNDPEVKAAMEQLFADVSGQPHVVGVTSPYSPEGETQISADGTIAYANVDMPGDIASAESQAISTFIESNQPNIERLTIERGTFYFASSEAPLSEALGLAFAILILIFALGSVIAMGLSITIALVGIGAGISLVFMLSHVIPVPEVASILGVMMGLGVGIDYALLIITRYREQIEKGQSTREAVAIAIDTAGRSVIFAGGTVVISLLSLNLVGVKFVQGLGQSASIVVLITIVASVTLLPALIGFLGHRMLHTLLSGVIAASLTAIGMLGIGFRMIPLGIAGFSLASIVLVAGGFIPALQRDVTMPQPKPVKESSAFQWSRRIQRRPWVSVCTAVLILLFLTIPMLSLRLGFSDESNAGAETTTKKAYELIAEGFGPGFAGPLMLAADGIDGTTPDDLQQISEAVRTDPGVAFVSDPMLSENGSAAIWMLVPTSGPQDEATTELVDRLRSDVVPPIEADMSFQLYVTGTNAVSIDYADYLQSRLVLVFVVVLSLSFILLMVVFRSLLVPLTAVIMNLLSIGAAYGVVVALFQWGWLSSLTGVQPAPIEPWLPMLLFAIVFGLSMDYEVFLLSRIREDWLHTGDSRLSVSTGLASTAKVITVAAAIMVTVFGSSIMDADRAIKLLGVGLAVAVLLDATVVRMLLVPATMELLGDKNWWLPGWLNRLLPRIDVEGNSSRLRHSEP